MSFEARITGKEKPWFQKPGIVAAEIALAIALVGTIGYTAVPFIHQTADHYLQNIGWQTPDAPIISSTFDNNQPINPKPAQVGEPGRFPDVYKTNPEPVKADINATPASKQDIQQILNQSSVLGPPRAEGYPPTLETIFPFDITNTQEVKINKIFATSTTYSLSLYGRSLWEIDIKSKEDIPVFIPLYPGSKSVSIRMIGLKDKLTEIEFTYTLTNGEKRTAEMNFDSISNYSAPNDISKELETHYKYDPREYNPHDNLPAKEFDLSKNQPIELFHITGSVNLSVEMFTGDSAPKPFSAELNAVTRNGKMLFLTANSGK